MLLRWMAGDIDSDASMADAPSGQASEAAAAEAAAKAERARRRKLLLPELTTYFIAWLPALGKSTLARAMAKQVDGTRVVTNSGSNEGDGASATDQKATTTTTTNTTVHARHANGDQVKRAGQGSLWYS